MTDHLLWCTRTDLHKKLLIVSAPRRVRILVAGQLKAQCSHVDLMSNCTCSLNRFHVSLNVSVSPTNCFWVRLTKFKGGGELRFIICKNLEPSDDREKFHSPDANAVVLRDVCLFSRFCFILYQLFLDLFSLICLLARLTQIEAHLLGILSTSSERGRLGLCISKHPGNESAQSPRV